MGAEAGVFDHANPYALAAILDASTTRHIVASQDIFDDRGMKLWARNQPVSQSLQMRLLERKLRQPLESCLQADDGITTYQLHEAFEAFLGSGHALAAAVAQWGTPLREGVQHLPLHAATQLLLTTVHATKPKVFEHAIRGMALAGAMQASVGGDPHAVRLALLGGLFHDLGEMYIDPQYLDGTALLDARGFRHVATHPRIGELVLSSLTDYPVALARAIGEHHERLDGSGYPSRSSGDKTSALGRLLCVVETTLGIVAAPTAPLARASLALRLIPGEFDGAWSGFVSSAAQSAKEDLQHSSAVGADELLAQLALMNTGLAAAHEQAQAMAEQAPASRVVREVAARAALALGRLRMGWNAIGMWSAPQEDVSPESHFELAVSAGELRYRMRGIQRECLWMQPELSEKDAQQLEPLWVRLSGRST